jgi:uncharacterized membrane protein (UPF0127 family)
MAESGAELRVVHNLTRDTVLANRLETGASLWAKFRGLMGRSSLRRNHALWLPDSSGIHMMFMRFPIDAVFLDRPDGEATRRVVAVHRELRPWTGLVPFVRSGHGVLELPAGMIEATSTALGDVIAFEDWPEAN